MIYLELENIIKFIRDMAKTSTFLINMVIENKQNSTKEMSFSTSKWFKFSFKRCKLQESSAFEVVCYDSGKL